MLILLLIPSGSSGPVTSTCSASLESIGASGSAGVTINGSAAAGLAPIEASVSVEEILAAAVSVAFEGMLAAASASEAISGSAQASLSPQLAAATGSEEIQTAGNPEISPLLAAATGSEEVGGSVAIDLDPVQAQATGEESINGSASPELSAIEAAGEAEAGGTVIDCTAPLAMAQLLANGTIPATGSQGGGKPRRNRHSGFMPDYIPKPVPIAVNCSAEIQMASIEAAGKASMEIGFRAVITPMKAPIIASELELFDSYESDEAACMEAVMAGEV